MQQSPNQGSGYIGIKKYTYNLDGFDTGGRNVDHNRNS